MKRIVAQRSGVLLGSLLFDGRGVNDSGALITRFVLRGSGQLLASAGGKSDHGQY